MTYHNAQKYILSSPDVNPRKHPEELLRRLWSELGNPQKNINYIRLAGSNGKTISAEMMVSVLSKADISVGTLTTTLRPDLRYNVTVNGAPISFEKMAELVELIYRTVNRFRKEASDTDEGEFAYTLTKQEILLCVALLIFKESNCELCLIESDHKRTDPTIFLPPPFMVAICGEIPSQSKSDIQMIRTYICHGIEEIISAPQDQNAYRIISNTCAAVNCRLTIPTKSTLSIEKLSLSGSEFQYKNKKYKIGLCGKFQVNNAIFVLELLERLVTKGYKLSYEQIYGGLRATKIPAKFEILSVTPTIIADSTHTDVAIPAVCESMSDFKDIIGSRIRVCLPEGSIVEKYLDTLKEQGYDVTRVMVFGADTEESYNGIPTLHCKKTKELIKNMLSDLGSDEILLISGPYTFTLNVRYELLSHLGF